MKWLTRIRQRALLDQSSDEEQRCQTLELEDAIAKLPRRLQQIAWMVSERWTEREMAAALGVSQKTANRLKHQALKLLARELVA
ncbi:MAG: hypothetical protein HY319_17225 [Armatimonadetes bacterium]|nr:hypothetical protein [Armatimonadota bacterium]